MLAPRPAIEQRGGFLKTATRGDYRMFVGAFQQSAGFLQAFMNLAECAGYNWSLHAAAAVMLS